MSINLTQEQLESIDKARIILRTLSKEYPEIYTKEGPVNLDEIADQLLAILFQGV